MDNISLDIIKILAAFAAGAVLGVEREYNSKPAGFRTMILICVGSCLFSILSLSFATNSDRIASNIVTGIGFIGAGVIFKEGVGVRGITSAATIWMAAAIGMAMGFGYFMVATVVLVLALITLISLIKIQDILDNFHQTRNYDICFCPDDYSVEQLEEEFKTLPIYFDRFALIKQNNQIKASYKIAGKKQHHNALTQFLIANKEIASFEV